MSRCRIVFVFFFICCGMLLWGCHRDSNGSNSDSKMEWDQLTGSEEPPEIDWVKINSGSFVFGSPPGTPCRAAYSEEQIEVMLTRSFVMAATELTQAQWEAMDLPNPSFTKGPHKPVTLINFYEAAVWCNKLSRLEGLNPCYDLQKCANPVGNGCITDETRTGEGCLNPDSQPVFHCDGPIHTYPDRYSCPGYRLPTSAEWEYAAKADVYETHTYGGDLFLESVGHCNEQPALEGIAWYCWNSNRQVHDVAQKLPNPWGLYDMLGNVAELTDYYFSGGRPLGADFSGGDIFSDPLGPSSGTHVELRGSGFEDTGCSVRPSDRIYENLPARIYFIGFRPVRTIFE